MPSTLRAGLGSSKDPRPKSPQSVPGETGDVEADHITTTSSAANGSNIIQAEMGSSETFDVNTFPISCLLEKDARGLYTLSGNCCLCGQTFRAVGRAGNGKFQPWNNHARLHHNIIKHARTHGAVGYTPHRNLDEMRLDWVRSPVGPSEIMADASASADQKNTTFCASCTRWRRTTPFRRVASTCRTCLKITCAAPGEASEVIPDASASGKQTNTTFCAGCAKWRWTTQFRRGASACRTCLKITCAACGEDKTETQYKTQDVYNFLNKRINTLCRTCRKKGMKLGGSKHKTHKGEHCRECRCTGCGVYQASSAFRRTKRGRVDICRECELVPCAVCAAVLSRRKFTDSDIYRYFYSEGAKHITCLACKERQHARQQRLQKLMNKSKRKACTCKHPHAHTRKCPLHVRRAGDRPYPGCDVMSRADSDWLLEQRKKNGYVQTS